MGERVTSVYPHKEAFLRYAAANCGLPAVHEGGHEEVVPESELTLLVPDQPQNIPIRRLRTVLVRVNAVRAAEFSANRSCTDRPFEGTVVKSDHKEIRRGHEVIGLAGKDCGALLVDTANNTEMGYLVRTFSDPAYRSLVTL